MAAISCSEGGGGGGTESAIFIWPLFWWAKAGNSSVASFLVWGGGATPQMYRHKIKKSYTCNLYARASASETYRPLFSHMVWRYKRQYRTKHWHWENLWIKLCERARSERARKLFPFSHSKTAISFNILLVLLILYLRNTYIFRSQITSSLHTINAVLCYYLWYGVVYKRQLCIPTKH